MQRDLMNNLDLKAALTPRVATDDTALTGSTIDMKGAMAAMFAIVTGTLADTDATFAVKLEEGDAANLSDAADVAAGDLVGTVALAGFTFAADDSCRKIGYRGTKRYVRLVVTPTGNTGNVPIAAVCVLDPQRKPAANPPA